MHSPAVDGGSKMENKLVLFLQITISLCLEVASPMVTVSTQSKNQVGKSQMEQRGRH